MQDFIKIGNEEFNTLLAFTPEEQQKGLMFRNPPLPCMTFVYGKPAINSFWMKNVNASLDIIFCNDNKVISICKGNPHSTAIVSCHQPSDLVVELPEGTCKTSGIKVGDFIELRLTKPSLLKMVMAKVAAY